MHPSWVLKYLIQCYQGIWATVTPAAPMALTMYTAWWHLEGEDMTWPEATTKIVQCLTWAAVAWAFAYGFAAWTRNGGLIRDKVRPGTNE
jgi:hypothetical protein